MLDGKSLGFATNRHGFESQLNTLLVGRPWEIISMLNSHLLISNMERLTTSQHCEVYRIPLTVSSGLGQI